MAEPIRWHSELPHLSQMALLDDVKAYPLDHIYPQAAGELVRPDLFALWHTYSPATREPFVVEGIRLSVFSDPTHRQTLFIPGAHVAPEVAALAHQHLWWLLDEGIGPISQESAKFESRVLDELQGRGRTALAAALALRGWDSRERHYAFFAANPVTPWRHSFPPPDNAPKLEAEFAAEQLRRNRVTQNPDYWYQGRINPPAPIYAYVPTWRTELSDGAL